MGLRVGSWELQEFIDGFLGSHVHLFVADVVKSFDTIKRGIWGSVLCRCANVRLRSIHTAGLSSATRDVVLLSVIVTVVLYVLVCAVVSVS